MHAADGLLLLMIIVVCVAIVYESFKYGIVEGRELKRSLIINGKNPKHMKPKAEIMYFLCCRELKILLRITFTCRPHLMHCSSNKT